MFRRLRSFLIGLCLTFAMSTLYPQPIQTASGCDKSYPDFCIPPPPPDLDCKDISRKNFRVLQPDPHKLDRDKDGIGCESRK
jgi:micrococcal nuclease